MGLFRGMNVREKGPSDKPQSLRARLGQKHLFRILALTLIPLLIFAMIFQAQLAAEQSEALKRGYSDNAAFIIRTVDTRLDETRDNLIIMGRNYSLQDLLFPSAYGLRRNRQELLYPFESYAWYHVSSARSPITELRIYASRLEESLGYFIRPAQQLPPSKREEWLQRGEFSELFYQSGDDGFAQEGLYFVQTIRHRRSNNVVAYAVAKLDPDRLFSVRPESNEPPLRYGLAFQMNGNTLYEGYADNLESKYLNVEAMSRYPGLRLQLKIPVRAVSLELWPIILSFVCSTLLALSISYYLARRIRIMTSEIELERRKIEALRISALRSQINPHFLYNVLSLVNWKAKYAGADEISEIVTDLSQFYRLSLNHGRETLKLREEFATIGQFMKLKFKLLDTPPTCAINLPAELENCEIPNFILQPLAENALIHGVAGLERKCHIEIAAARGGAKPGEQDSLWLWVLDDGRGISRENMENARLERGYGLKNVDERIKLLCGPQFGLSIYSGNELLSFSQTSAADDCSEQWPASLREAREAARKRGSLALLHLREVKEDH